LLTFSAVLAEVRAGFFSAGGAVSGMFSVASDDLALFG
jgi:hypothetical protein